MPWKVKNDTPTGRNSSSGDHPAENQELTFWIAKSAYLKNANGARFRAIPPARMVLAKRGFVAKK